MANKLIKLSVGEVSGVDRAANLREFLVQKAAAAWNAIKRTPESLTKDGAKTFAECLDETAARKKAQKLRDRLWSLWWALEDSIDSIVTDQDVINQRSAIEDSIQEFVDYLESESLITKELAAEHMEKFSVILKEMPGMSMNGGQAAPGQPGEMDMDAKHAMMLQQMKSMIDGLLQDIGAKKEPEPKKEETPMPEAAGTVTKAAGAAPEELLKQYDEIKKGLDVIRKELDDEKLKNVDLTKRAEVAETIAKKEQEERLLKEAKFDVAKDMAAIPDNAELGAIVKAVRSNEPLTKEQGEALEKMLRAANEAITKGKLFEERGGSFNGEPAPNGVVEKVNKAVAEVRKANTNLSEVDAMSQVFRNNPSLYNEYQAKSTIAVQPNDY